VFPPGEAREDWTIFRALADVLGVTLGFDTFEQLRAAMADEVPALGTLGLADFGWQRPALTAPAPSGPIGTAIADFYLTNAICRASPTMQRCSAELLHGETFLEAAE
jgi:NADH-quinone oxidoreductase subunit G